MSELDERRRFHCGTSSLWVRHAPMTRPNCRTNFHRQLILSTLQSSPQARQDHGNKDTQLELAHPTVPPCSTENGTHMTKGSMSCSADDRGFLKSSSFGGWSTCHISGDT